MAKTELELIPNEEIQSIVKGKIFATTDNVFLNFLLQIKRVLLMIVGIHETASLIVTNKRLVLERRSLVLWCCPSAASFQVFCPNGIARVGYSYEALICFCLCRKYLVSFALSSGEGYSMVLKGGSKQASELANKILDVVITR